MATLKAEGDEQNSIMRKWQEQVSGDMQVFYNEYDDKIKEVSVTDEER